MNIRFDYSDVQFAGNGKLKLLIIVGTRPEIIRLAAVITKCRKHFDCVLAHTGQNYDYNLNGVFFRDLKLEDPEVYMNAVGDDLGATVGNIINCSYKLMTAIHPDALLILGDTNSCLSAIAPSGSIFRFSIWRPVTAVRTNAFRRRPTAGSWTSFRTSTCVTRNMHDATLPKTGSRRSGPMLPAPRWRRCCMRI